MVDYKKMKKSEIHNEANQSIKEIYKYVLKSNEKITWDKAIKSINDIIYKYKQEIKYDTKTIKLKKKYVWEKIRNIMLKKYGEKFIK